MTFKVLFRFLAAILIASTLSAPALAQLQGLGGGGATAPAEAQAPAEPSADDRSALDDLIRILETPETRDRLIESLRSMAYQPADPRAEAEDAAEEAPSLADSVPATLAQYTRGAVEAVQSGVATIGTVGEEAVDMMAGTGSIDLPRVLGAMLPVLSVALAAFGAYFGLSFVARPILDFLARQARKGYPIRRLGLLVGAFVVSAAKILLSGVAGHVGALIFSAGPPNFDQALFLNAFVLTGLLQVCLSVFVAPYHPALRMTPFGDKQARYWYVRLVLLLILLGYTFLFFAPIVEANSNLRAGNAVRLIVVLAAYLTMVVWIIQNRTVVRERLQRAALAGANDFQSKVNYLLGHTWWFLALGFVTALFILWMSSPETGFQFMLTASLKSLAAITVGGLAITILSRIIMSGIKVPATTRERFPLLEHRINGFIPKVLFVLRCIVIVVVFVALIEAWQIAELGSWVQTPMGQRVVGGGTSALIILCVAFAIYLLMSSWVEYRLNPNFGTVPAARERTLLSLFRNAFTIVLGVITMMLVLSQIGIDIAPLLAGAGVVGLAVGFGAQKLVQDIITGAFIQVENVMNEGDVVSIGATAGVVEKLTIRSVSLRSLDGTYHLIPFSSVDQVSNMTKDFSHFVADVEVAYREDSDDVRDAMHEAFELLRESDQGANILGEFEFFGVEALGASSVTLRGRVRTLPGKQWGVGRLYKELIKRVLDRRRIEIPFPQTTVWFGTGKDGSAPPLRLMRASEGSQHAEVARSVVKETTTDNAEEVSRATPEDADRREAVERAEEERSDDEDEVPGPRPILP